MASSRTLPSAVLPLGPLAEQAGAGQPAEGRRAGCCRCTDMVCTRPSRCRSSGTRASPAAMRARTVPRCSSLPRITDLAGVAARAAHQALDQLGAAGAHQAVDADDLARAHGQRDVVDQGPVRAGTVRPRPPAARRRPGRAAAREQRVGVAADHLPHDPRRCRSWPSTRARPGAVAEHGDAVADAAELVELVRDVDDGDVVARAGRP